MAESIKKFIIKDAHGGTKESGYFSVVGDVHVNLVPGYGEPYAESVYVNGILTITIHNIEGNGITEITTDSQEGDEAVNTVTIKTNANPEGVVLEVRNGSRGNGIASISEVLSPEDGGTNTHTITDTDGNEHVFHTTNGHKGDKGDQGDSAVYDPSSPDAPDFVMANTTGQSTTKAMTQKAVTDAIDIFKTDVYASFDIIDTQGYVLARFSDGHFKTSEFDSRLITGHQIHFSFDDVEYSIISLFSGEYSSVWDCPFFAYLKYLHDTYGAVFTMNMFISDFAIITNQFSNELGNASSWLKWTLHGDKNENYATRNNASEDWNNMVDAVVTMTGTPNAIDRHTRLSNFAGTEENIVAMKNQRFGAICFSCADSINRLSYNFDTNEAAYCWSNGEYYNSKNNLNFVKSYPRFDGVTMSTNVRNDIINYIKGRRFSEFFIHEYSVINSSLELVTSGVDFLTSFFDLVARLNCINTFFYKTKNNY